jgi:hypothetical protein
VTNFRQFSNSQGLAPKARTVDSDAPGEFRNELVDLVFSLAAEPLTEYHLHRLMTQNIGVSVSANPYGGYRYAIGRDLGRADWVRVYDLLPRLAAEFRQHGRFEEFRTNLNRLLAGNAIVWDMNEEGNLVRFLPAEAESSVGVAIRELARPEFEAAHRLLMDAIDAYNAQPQRARDACANAFDAIESAGKIVAEIPSGTFDDVLKKFQTKQALARETIRMLQELNTMRHNHFGHGMTEPFSLSSPEVDFVYVSCIAAAILFARMYRGDFTT